MFAVVTLPVAEGEEPARGEASEIPTGNATEVRPGALATADNDDEDAAESALVFVLWRKCSNDKELEALVGDDRADGLRGNDRVGHRDSKKDGNNERGVGNMLNDGV